MASQPGSVESYRIISKEPVSVSEQIDENVIADYDSMGNVVGLEFLDPAAATEWEKFLALANRKRPIITKAPKPPSN